MMLNVQLVFAAVLAAVSVSAGPLRVRDASDADIARLAPLFDFDAGLNPTGTGDCDGAVNGGDGRPIKIPCSCPPPRDQFIASLQANVHAGKAVKHPEIPVSFPVDDSRDSQLARVEAAKVTLQNLFGSGVGCPVASTTFQAQEQAIRSGNAPPAAPAPAPPAPTADVTPPANNGGDDVARLAPDLGFEAGRNPTGTGDCDGAVNGANGQPIKIPCSCPPSRDVFIDALRKNVQAGHAVNNPNIGVQFPVDDSIGAQITRITAALITIQNLNGPGSGCPAASTTLVAQQTALREGNAAPAAPAPAPPAPTPDVASPPANSGGDDVARLAPDLGFEAGRNPNGTGDCDGAVVGANGQPVKVPCSCPPPRDVYIDALRKNVQAGHAVNNPSISVSFPLDDSKASQSARITAALISLQNLNGPGVGCPAASTTLLAQQKAL